jgi:uncharacterized protein YjbK
MKQQDSYKVEVKLEVANSDIKSTLNKLDLTLEDADYGKNYFLDTDDLTLEEAGIIFRLRQSDTSIQTTVKLRPEDPNAIDDKWF